jgi:RNA polymerase sigma-70 factor, ECF subfamily
MGASGSSVSERVQHFLCHDARNVEPDRLGSILQLYWNYLHLLAEAQLDRRLRVRFSPSDLVQETLMEAHRDFQQFRGTTEAEFLAWLRQILVHNLLVAVRRHLEAGKRDIRREISLEQVHADLDTSALSMAAILAQGGTSPSAHVQREELLVALADSLASLPPDYREVIVSRHMEGQSFAEIAEGMGRSEGAVRMLWLRAIGQLRAKMGERDVA